MNDKNFDSQSESFKELEQVKAADDITAASAYIK